ncbi:Transcriptional regulatory protein SIN3 [Psilocybe cubensis]|uniref:Transcriptional regulatory protein SIN3 n=2 Tax=Psilocybe cubensis TaxID=181762 RepID=A0ACB8GPM3_PSICU|nr:Transcriptional regulatory protein SIN3 [Psilocybe cubensis]KAH9477606.1 Transcriptional regulatory protein SIN3 [Psilocybe cubensis]
MDPDSSMPIDSPVPAVPVTLPPLSELAPEPVERIVTPLDPKPAQSLDTHLPPVATTSQRSRRGSPMDPQSYSNIDRPLNVTDALSYLDAVKIQFQDQPDVYNHFLDIMKEFKNEQIDTPGVIKRVSHLFNGHPMLIQGFNTFLPVGYRIECSKDPYDPGYITVTTPSGTTIQTTGSGSGRLSWSTAPAAPVPRHELAPGFNTPGEHNAPMPVASPDPRTYGMDGQAIEPAVQYVQKIKQRCDPETYRQFLDILSRYHHKPDTIDEEEVSKQIARLFKDAPDLRADFRVFMPDRSQQLMEDTATTSLSHARDREKTRRTGKLDSVVGSMSNHHSTSNAPVALPQKRKRKPAEKEREREKEPTPVKTVAPPAKKAKHGSSTQDVLPTSYPTPKPIASAPSSPRRSSHQVLPPQEVAPRAPPVHDKTLFFDRVKRALDNRDLYNEFLKLANLFAHDYIDTARLVKESRNFLGNTELYTQFREILGWDDKKEREHFLSEQHTQSNWAKPAIAGLPERPGRIDLGEKYGSYRRVSATDANVPCSGRDDMCRSVLNDEWVSHPTWTSEDSGFISQRKNIYEEALHRSEEERHEYDFHIEAIVRTIAMLEPINNKIAQMNPDDRASFKLKPNLNGTWKAIHQRVIKKIYGREAGLDVIAAMQETPAAAIPVVLQRLKQKEEEWKRAQREWNKVWRDVDARNYAKSLDCQAVMWKVSDKKAITVKAFVNQVETAREEQHAKRAALIDPLFARTRPRYQLSFEIDVDEGILQDVVKLTFSYLDRTQGQLSAVERKRIENFMRVFVPLFFVIGSVEFNAGLVHQETVVESDVEVGNNGVPSDGEDVGEGPSSTPPPQAPVAKGRNGRKHTANVSSGGDLRKKLLKSEQAKMTNRKTRGGPSPAVSRFASPAVLDDERGVGGEAMFVFPPGAGKRSSKFNNVFFTNTSFYALMRLIELLYARLKVFKGIAAELASKDESSSKGKANANNAATKDNKHHYEILLGQCEALFTNELEQHVFEDQTRAVFGYKEAYKIFTVDKVVSAIIKQVQSIISDPKSQELLELLKRERSLNSPTTQDRINYRHQAENILGPDENVFRIDWLSESKTMTIQLIGKDDSMFDDSEALTGRWQSYVDAFVSGDTTEGVLQSRVKKPYLRRNLPSAVKETVPDVSSQDGLEIKVCLRTYRLFYGSHTEDIMWKYRSKDEVERNSVQLAARNALRRKWLANLNSSKTDSAIVAPGSSPSEDVALPVATTETTTTS